MIIAKVEDISYLTILFLFSALYHFFGKKQVEMILDNLSDTHSIILGARGEENYRGSNSAILPKIFLLFAFYV